MASRQHVRGRGLINTLINKLPVELHIPGYQYCGPGTKLLKRLARGDPGINPLDKACKDHDIAYSTNSNLEDRHRADYQLEQRAWDRVKSKDASIGEKAAAWAVTNAMKVKRKLGMGMKKQCNRKKVGFRRAVVNTIANILRKNTKKNLKKDAAMTVKAARIAVRNAGGRKKIKTPRVLPLPKTGGILPLIPIFAGLSALGALSGGAAAVAKTVVDAKNSRKTLEEAKRHNKAMEDLAIGKKGSGLYMKPYKNGYGLYLKNDQKNYQ